MSQAERIHPSLHVMQQRLEKAVLSKNPLLVQGLSLTPVVAVAYNLKAALALAAVTAAMLVPLEVLSSLFLKKCPAWLRTALYLVYGVGTAALFTPLITAVYLGVGITLGVYLPLMAVNSLLLSRCDCYAVKNTARNSLVDGLTFSAGAAIVLVFVGVVREFLGSGTLFGIPVGIPKLVPSMVYPFAGLLLLGFLAALGKAYTLGRAQKPPETSTQKEDALP